MKLEFHRNVLGKYANTKFNENLPNRSQIFPCGQTDGRADVTKLTVVFRNFSNAPKNYDTQLEDIEPHTNIRCHFTKLSSTFCTATVWSDFPLLVIHSCSNNPAGLAATAQLFCPQGE